MPWGRRDFAVADGDGDGAERIRGRRGASWDCDELQNFVGQNASARAQLYWMLWWASASQPLLDWTERSLVRNNPYPLPGRRRWRSAVSVHHHARRRPCATRWDSLDATVPRRIQVLNLNFLVPDCHTTTPGEVSCGGLLLTLCQASMKVIHLLHSFFFWVKPIPIYRYTT